MRAGNAATAVGRKQIYKDKQAGYYSVRQEQFLTDKERGPDGEFGPEWGEVEFREEENYYFKLSEHKEWLLQFLRSNPNFVSPSFRQTELVNAVEKLTGDLCISRPKSRLSWGIELPFDRDYVNYVWFDALSNYISFIGYDPSRSTISDQPSTFLEKWPALHVIGKDIMVPAHGIYWPIMLHALGFPDDQMPTLLVHGWWNISGAKMSKSLGNVIDPASGTQELEPRLRIALEKFNTGKVKKNQQQMTESEIVQISHRCAVDAFRYYLMSDIVTGNDADFFKDRLITRYNAELANSIGNLTSRAIDMMCRYLGGALTSREDAKLKGSFRGVVASYKNFMNRYIVGGRVPVSQTDSGLGEDLDVPVDKPIGALGNVHILAQFSNRIIERTAPWELAKDPDKRPGIEKVLYTVAESLRLIAILISPVLPKAAHGIFDQLNWKMELSGKEERFSLADAEWGGLPDGHVVGKPVPLFPRIETK